MFCCRNGQHYTLTCFHVACASDENRLNAVTYKAQDIQKMCLSLSNLQAQAREKEYYFRESKGDNKDEAISYGDDGSNYLSDILSLKIPNDVKLVCRIEGVTSSHWERIHDQLSERVFFQNSLVNVEKNGFSSALTKGYIVPNTLSYSGALFKDA